jgi:hypothetical protein
MRFEKIWIEQCRATRAIKRRFGVKAALDYLVSEKLRTLIPRKVGNRYQSGSAALSTTWRDEWRFRRPLYTDALQQRHDVGTAVRSTSWNQLLPWLRRLDILSGAQVLAG